MGGLIGGLIGGVGSYFSGRSQASAQRHAAERAAQTARLGFDYLTGSPVAGYLDTGGQANNAIAALLGVGGDPAAARQGFQNYLGSTGYQAQLGAGQDAITTNAAARGLLQSGDTLRSSIQYGQDLMGQRFDNYLGQLGGLSQQGLSAGGVIGGAASQAGATGAQAIGQGYGAAAQTDANARAGLFGGLAQAGQGFFNFMGG